MQKCAHDVGELVIFTIKLNIQDEQAILNQPLAQLRANFFQITLQSEP